MPSPYPLLNDLEWLRTEYREPWPDRRMRLSRRRSPSAMLVAIFLAAVLLTVISGR